MSNLTWDAETLATGGQLLMAAAIAVQVLVLRPRAARENLALTARIIGDDVTLDQNHGLLPIRDADVERVRQLLTRVGQDPAAAKNVLLAADGELAYAPEDDDLPTIDRIRIEAYLTRLADACSRYLHDSWPRTGATQRPRHAFRRSSGPVAFPEADPEMVAHEAVDPAGLVAEAGPGVISHLVEPFAPLEPPRLIDLDEAAEPVESAEPVQPVQSVELVQSVEPAGSGGPADSVGSFGSVVDVPDFGFPEDDDTSERRIIITRPRTSIDLTQAHDDDQTIRVPAAHRWERTV